MNPAQWAVRAKSSGMFPLQGNATVWVSEAEGISVPPLDSRAGAFVPCECK